MSAHWARWADSLRMIHRRHPAVADTMITHLSEPNDIRHFLGASTSCEVSFGLCSTRLEVTRHSSATETCSSSSRGAPTRAGSTMRLRLWKDTSSILQFGLCWAVSARCCVPRVALCQVSRSWLCRSLPCQSSTLTCSVFFS